MDCGFEMDLSDRYPVWSTGESNRKVNIAPMNDLNSNNLMNVSDVPAWDSSACDVWPQTAFSKGNGVCGDVESLMSSGNTLDLTEGTPAWASNPSSWDHDSATRLAEKLLPFQSELSAADQLGRDVGNKDMTMMNSQFSHGGYKFEQLVPTGGGSSNPRFKTEFCRNFREKGDCVYGAQCQFAHGKAELRHDVIRHSKYKTKLCQKYWINGWCAYGTRCNFIHQEESNSSGDKTRTLTNQTGFRPLLPGRNMRKSSESSADSGVDFGLFNPKVGGEKCLTFASNRFEADNEFYPSSDTGGVRHLDYSRISSFGMVDANLSNMNLATELNRNLYNYMDVKEKEKRSVPHPEDNPIPAPSAAVNSFNRNSEFRLLSGIPNSWAL